MINDLFKNFKVNKRKLVTYGFDKKNDFFTYSKPIMNDQFLFNVFVDNTGEISTKLFDANTNEEYILYKMEDVSGSFVGTIRTEIFDILSDIKDKCFEKNIFKSEQSLETINYIKTKFDDDLEFLWEKFPNNAIWRRKDNRKWYAAILTVNASKLNINKDEEIEIIDLKTDENQINEFIDNKTIFPGYHMNKKHWITVPLDHSMPNEKLFNLINRSYELSN